MVVTRLYYNILLTAAHSVAIVLPFNFGREDLLPFYVLCEFNTSNSVGSEMDQYHLYQCNGKEIFDKYCSSTETRPVMLPRAPSQKYIDVYPEEPSFANDIQQQFNYEAEVTVYRCLQDSDENIIVLHSFQYTHHQYRLCDKNHVRKGCRKCKKASNVEGECDFLVIGETFFVLIEVKNIKNNLQRGKKTKLNSHEYYQGHSTNQSNKGRKRPSLLEP